MMDIVERLRKQHIVTTKKLFPYIPFHEYVSWGDAADEIEQLRKQLEETSIKHERLVFSTMGDLSLRDKEIEGLRQENAKLKEEVEDLDNRLIEAGEMADYYG
jgi:DNA repair ATPase RecN